jgi:hypothetical protein
VKPPPWLAQKIAETGALQLVGGRKAAEAEAEILAAAREHPEFGEEQGAAAALAAYRKWVRCHVTGGDLFQAQMLHGLPESMLITPTKSKPVAAMTAADLDHARNMLLTRTANAIKGARQAAMDERAAFDAFYARVRPLLDGGLTVADVIGKVALNAIPDAVDPGQPDWLVLALARMEPEAVAGEIARHPEYLHGLLTGIATGLHDGLSLDEAIRTAAEKAA